jgi:hypothetical protein
MRLLRCLLALPVVFFCSSALCADTPGFRSYLFDGSAFVESRAEGAILVRDGLLPVLSGEGSPREDPLPAGTGALAVLCYRQSSGGKLGRYPRIIPVPGTAVVVHGTGFTLAARADAGGYVILALAPGRYELKVFGHSKPVVVEPGKTALVPIRGGKRMVD